MKSREEVEQLKRHWEDDPCWDIEETEGFEEYTDELRAFHEQKGAEWVMHNQQNLMDLSIELGIPGDLKTASQHQSGQWAYEACKHRAEDLLLHYFDLALSNSNLSFADKDTEIRSIVSNILDAAESMMTAHIAVALALKEKT